MSSPNTTIAKCKKRLDRKVYSKQLNFVSIVLIDLMNRHNIIVFYEVLRPQLLLM
jgi:hypothetical protein